MSTTKLWLGITALYLGLTAAVAAGGIKPGQQVEIRTELGTIVVELDPVASPRSCETFLSYIHQHVYQESGFKQTDTGDIQGGYPGPLAKGFSASGNFFHDAPPGEFKLKHVRGAVGLARTSGDCNPTKTSNSTQFYIMWKDEPMDDGEYSIFGHVVRGMDVVDEISRKLRKGHASPVKFDVIAP